MQEKRNPIANALGYIFLALTHRYPMYNVDVCLIYIAFQDTIQGI